jgi:hypothetical protein
MEPAPATGLRKVPALHAANRASAPYIAWLFDAGVRENGQPYQITE